MQEMPKVGDLYQHFRGEVYKIVPCPKDGDTGENIVNSPDTIWYQNIETYQTYQRHIDIWLLPKQLPAGDKVQRFTKL